MSVALVEISMISVYEKVQMRRTIELRSNSNTERAADTKHSD